MPTWPITWYEYPPDSVLSLQDCAWAAMELSDSRSVAPKTEANLWIIALSSWDD